MDLENHSQQTLRYFVWNCQPSYNTHNLPLWKFWDKTLYNTNEHKQVSLTQLSYKATHLLKTIPQLLQNLQLNLQKTIVSTCKKQLNVHNISKYLQKFQMNSHKNTHIQTQNYCQHLRSKQLKQYQIFFKKNIFQG